MEMRKIFRSKTGSAEIDSAELMIGYSSGSVNTFGVELRYARVFKVEGTSDLFYGAGTGIISKDSTRGLHSDFFQAVNFFQGAVLILVFHLNLVCCDNRE